MQSKRTNALMFLTAVSIILFLCKPVAADENEFRCLKSVASKNPVQLQFTFEAGKDDLGYVTYQRGSGRIQVKKISDKELRRVPGGRPSELEWVWEEITPDGPGGRYVMVIQGARIYDFKYTAKKNGKTLKFEEDLEAFTEKGCRWTR